MNNELSQKKLISCQEAQAVLIADAQHMQIRSAGLYTGSLLYIDLAASDAYTDNDSVRLTAWCGEWRILVGNECRYSWENVTRDLAETSIKSLCYGRSLLSFDIELKTGELIAVFSGELSIRIGSNRIAVGTPLVDVNLPSGSGFTAFKEHLPSLVCG